MTYEPTGTQGSNLSKLIILMTFTDKISPLDAITGHSVLLLIQNHGSMGIQGENNNPVKSLGSVSRMIRKFFSVLFRIGFDQFTSQGWL